MTKPEVVVVYTTVPDEGKAEEISRALVENRLAACVSRFSVQSVYRWKGEIVKDPEVLLMIKTHPDKVESLRAFLLSVHPYEVPEFLVLPVIGDHPPYGAWVKEVTAS